MKGLLIVVAAFAVLGVQAESRPDPGFIKVEEATEKCIQESGIDPVEVKNKKEYDFDPDAANMEKFLYCFVKKIELVDKNGNYQISNIVKFKKEIEGIDDQSIQEMINECLYKKDTNDKNPPLEILKCYSLIVKLEKVKNKCVEETGIPRKIADDNDNCIIPPSRHLKEYLVCRTKALNILGSEGEILKPGQRDYLVNVMKIRDNAKVEKILAECSDQKETPEETVFESRKCVCSEVKK